MTINQTFDPETFTEDSKKNWDQAAPHYERISTHYFAPVTKAFVDFAELRPGQSVLDVACGPGTATEAAALKVGPSGSVLGTDLSPEMLKIASSRCRKSAGGSVEFKEMNAEKMDLPDRRFDRVICQLGLMLFAKPKEALKEMARVVKKEGRVCCLVQGTADKMVFTSLLMKTMIKRAPQLKVPGAPSLYDFGSPGILEQALSQAGLSSIASERLTGTFAFSSPKDYWETMTSGAGRTGSMLKSLAPEIRRAVEDDALAKAAGYRAGGGLEIPYEFVMAKATLT